MFNSKNKATFFITMVWIIIGFMIAIQFTSSKEPSVAEPRDNMDLRLELQKELKRKEGLLNDLQKSEQLLYEYENSLDSNSVDIMAEELEKAKLEAGLVPIEGSGMIIKIEQMPGEEFAGFSDSELGSFSLQLADEDLRTLANELFNSGALAVSINNHRLVSTSTIRNIGDRIQVNTNFVSLPLELRVLGDADKITAGLIGMEDYFKLLNLHIIYEKKSYLQVPAYEDSFKPRYMKPVKEGE